MPISPEQAHTHPEVQRPSPKQRRLLTLFIASFEHSQGFQEVQLNIFRYLHAAFPDLTMSIEMREWLIQRSTETISRLLGVDAASDQSPFPHVPTNEFAVLKTVAPVAERFSKILNDPIPCRRDPVIAALTNGIIDRDYRYLVEQRSRQARAGRGDRRPNTSRLRDPYFSYVCTYVLLGQSTGIRELDALYRSVGVRCQQHLAERAQSAFITFTAHRLEQVVAIHNRHHPETPIDLPVPLIDET